ncbi:hypothetical protein L2E82_31606 [Cichorium intybus]|uniref:Uncharacterized protein n=1 Tax=Cichorium intybus TaxID=13427 RepID=A0ACB9BFQ2_CICIN|nr:hypothetical protein L2E82_31606 [Cichorium intybus]
MNRLRILLIGCITRSPPKGATLYRRSVAGLLYTTSARRSRSEKEEPGFVNPTLPICVDLMLYDMIISTNKQQN